MKKLFDFALVSFAALMLFSCEPAEQGYTVEQYYDNIFTVNKSAVVPEFSDSTLIVSNISQYGLQTGDRAHMILRYYFDYETMKKPELKVYQIINVIPTLSLVPKEEIDTLVYNTPFNKLHKYEFMDRYAQPVWVWKNRQNINISYFGLRDDASFAMSVTGVNEDCVELELRAKAKRSGNVTASRLLTFDLSNVADYLTEEHKKSIAGIDSLRTRIYFNREENGVVKRVDIIGGKIANPVK